MEEATLELSELLARANRLRDSIPELADTDAFTERTVYYYVQQGLLPRASRRRGPGTTYPADFVDRLLFIRRLQKESSLTLANIREVMERASPETIHDVARGTEPLEIRFGEGIRPEDREVHKEMFALRSFEDRGRASYEKPPSSMSMKDDFEDDAVFGRASYSSSWKPSVRKQGRGAKARTSYPVGKHAELKIFRPLSALQQKRVEQMVELLKSILEEDD
jgi:DNA-binding transcriptional MerR regulator